MKKLLALLLALLMVLSLVACGGEKAPAEEKPAEETPAASEETPAEEEKPAEESNWQEEHPTWLCEEKTTLTVMTYDGVNNTFPPPSNDLPFWQFVEEYTNVHINWEVLPLAGYPEAVATRLASGAGLPDVMCTNDYAIAKNAGEGGLFLDLAPYWDEIFTNTETFYSEQGIDYKGTWTDENGSIYALSSTNSPIEGYALPCYNTLWLEKLGMEVPETIDEFVALLRAIKDAGDLNGNGEADEIPLTSHSRWPLTTILGRSFGVEQYEKNNAVYYNEETGKVEDEYTADYMRETLSWLNSLYDEGLLDAEIGSMSMDLLSEKIAADRVGVFVSYSSFAFSYGALTSAAVESGNANGEYYTLGFALGSEKYPEPFMTHSAIAGAESTGVTRDCENPELAMKWLDTLLADPGLNEVRIHGFEGEDWEWGDNGERVLIVQPDGSYSDVQQKGCGQLTLPRYHNEETLLSSLMISTPWYTDQWAVHRAKNWIPTSVPLVSVFTAEEQEKYDMVATDIKTYYDEMVAKFILGDEDVDDDAAWQHYDETMDQLGMETFVEVFQSVYDRTR